MSCLVARRGRFSARSGTARRCRPPVQRPTIRAKSHRSPTVFKHSTFITRSIGCGCCGPAGAERAAPTPAGNMYPPTGLPVSAFTNTRLTGVRNCLCGHGCNDQGGKSKDCRQRNYCFGHYIIPNFWNDFQERSALTHGILKGLRIRNPIYLSCQSRNLHVESRKLHHAQLHLNQPDCNHLSAVHQSSDFSAVLANFPEQDERRTVDSFLAEGSPAWTHAASQRNGTSAARSPASWLACHWSGGAA